MNATSQAGGGLQSAVRSASPQETAAPSSFRYFNPNGAKDIHGSWLPHGDQSSTLCFVTSRLTPFLRFLAIVFPALFLCRHSDAAAVVWNDGFSITGTIISEYQSQNDYWLRWTELSSGEYEQGQICPNFNFTVDVSGNVATIRPVEGMNYLLAAYGDSWAKLEEGDIVCAGTTRNLDSYFFKGWMDWNGDTSRVGYSDYPITLILGSETPVYLGFATYGPDDMVLYGWVGLTVDSGGIPSIASSAIDFSGGPLVVGQIPEPGTGCLAAMGAVVLLFKKRKRPDRPANIIHALPHGMQGDGTGNATSPLADIQLI